MDAIKEYKEYIEEHRKNVRKAYNWLVNHNIISANSELEENIYRHDMSKYAIAEFDGYKDYFFRDSDTDMDLYIVKRNFEYAWLHHIHSNPHHWNYWLLVDDKEFKPLKMPENYVLEMICDWFAFSFKKNRLEEVLNWYNANKTNMILHDTTRVYVEFILNKIEEELKKIKDKESEN